MPGNHQRYGETTADASDDLAVNPTKVVAGIDPEAGMVNTPGCATSQVLYRLCQ
jgi:hypothetical protein